MIKQRDYDVTTAKIDLYHKKSLHTPNVYFISRQRGEKAISAFHGTTLIHT